MDYDVAIIGGAFSGAATALMLKRRCPNARVLIIEKTTEFDRKVGESTTEVTWDGQAEIWENGILLAETARFPRGAQYALADVDLDLLSTAIHQTSYPALWYMNENDVTQRTPRSAHPSATPSQMFRSGDGWMFVMCQLPKFWKIMTEKIGHPELASDPRFATEPDRLRISEAGAAQQLRRHIRRGDLAAAVGGRLIESRSGLPAAQSRQRAPG